MIHENTISILIFSLSSSLASAYVCVCVYVHTRVWCVCGANLQIVRGIGMDGIGRCRSILINYRREEPLH